MKTNELEDIRNKAAERFRSGFNCAETVFMAGSEMIGREPVPSVVTGFGGGLSAQDSLCGAMTGGIAAIGLYFGRTDGKDQATKKRVYDAGGEFVRAFREKLGSINCTDLCGCNMSTPEGKEQFFREDRHNRICTDFVLQAIDLLAEVFRREGVILG